MNCEICGGNIGICRVNNNFYECELCKTQIRIDVKAFDMNFYETTYLQDDVNEARVMNLNLAHYEKLFKLLGSNNKFIEFKNDLFHGTINDTFCYGGGFPQIESFLPPKNITVCDFIADQYEKKLHIFKEVFDSAFDKKITYKKWNLEDGVIHSLDTPVLLTFVHILEHLSIGTVNSILKSIYDNVATGSYVIIYQPNPNMARHNKWVHYAQEHITLIPINTLTKHINTFNSKFSVKVSVSFSDDLLIIFKKE